MRRTFRCIGLALLISLLTVFMFNAAHADDPDGVVDVAEKAELNTKRSADTDLRWLDNANALYSKAASEYAANQSKINKGVVITSATLLATSVTVYLTGGVTANVAVSTLVTMLELGEAIVASTALESAYETAIGEKVSRVSTFESKVSQYNTAYDSYISTLASHTGRTTSEVRMLIGDGTNPAVPHKGRSGQHGGIAQHTWGPYDKSTPSFTCLGPCSDTFPLPSQARKDHKKKCGTGKNVEVEVLDENPGIDISAVSGYVANKLLNRTVEQGCGRNYYDCPSVPDEEHKERTCQKQVEVVSDFDGQTYYHTCGAKFRRCMGHTRKHTGAWKTLHSDSVSTESPVVSPPPTPTPTPPPSPTYHACGVHETSVSGDHSLQASCSSTDSNGNSCTVTNFYACDSHTHSYPAPPPTPTPTPPPEPTPTPPSPTTVACGAAGWTGCTIRSSDGNACRVDPCDSGCGSYYWSCSTSGVSWHKTSRTCQRANCGASYTNCTRGDGTCSGGKYTWHKQ